ACAPHPAVLDHAYVELHDVTVLNPTLTTDSVHDFVVERDANVSRENAMTESITEERALHFRVAHEIRSRFVDFFGCNSWTNQLGYSIESSPGIWPAFRLFSVFFI